MDPRFAVGLPTVGEFGDVRTLPDLAVVRWTSADGPPGPTI